MVAKRARPGAWARRLCCQLLQLVGRATKTKPKCVSQHAFFSFSSLCSSCCFGVSPPLPPIPSHSLQSSLFHYKRNPGTSEHQAGSLPKSCIPIPLLFLNTDSLRVGLKPNVIHRESRWLVHRSVSHFYNILPNGLQISLIFGIV